MDNINLEHSIEQGKDINTFSCQENMTCQIYWSLPHRQSQETLRPHKLGFHCERVPRSNQDRFFNPKWVELRWLATCICQQEPESLFCMCFCHHYTVHSKNKRYRQERSQEKQTPQWPVTWGTKGLPCMHTEEVQTEFMTALSLLFLITSPPISGH